MTSLYLDMDGVMADMCREDPCLLAPSCVAVLNRAIKDFSIDRVVLSSSWRLREGGFQEACRVLERAGYEGPGLLNLPVDRKAREALRHGRDPWCDIGADVIGDVLSLSCVDSFDLAGEPFVILDDSRETVEVLGDHFVQTDARKGLLESDLARIERVLFGTWSREERVDAILSTLCRLECWLSSRESYAKEYETIATARLDLAFLLRRHAEKARGHA